MAVVPLIPSGWLLIMTSLTLAINRLKTLILAK